LFWWAQSPWIFGLLIKEKERGEEFKCDQYILARAVSVKSLKGKQLFAAKNCIVG
jgi:hypothetical protein